MSRIQPFNAPIDESITASASAPPAQGPQIAVAASENGAGDWLNASRGRMPITAIVPSR